MKSGKMLYHHIMEERKRLIAVFLFLLKIKIEGANMETRQEYVEVLKEVVDYIKQEKRLQEAHERLENAYERLELFNMEDALFEFLQKEYGDEDDMYLLLTQYVHKVLGKERAELEYIEKVLELLVKENSNLFLKMNLDMQSTSLAFRNGVQRDFTRRWNINQKCKEELKEMLPAGLERIPVEKRDKQFVVILVPQLLGEEHAPTKLVLEFGRIMQVYLKKKVLILNVVLDTDQELMKTVNVSSNYFFAREDKWNGRGGYKYKDVSLNMYQIILRENNISELVQVVYDIYNMRPFCVWSFSGMAALAGAMQEFTSYIHTSTGQGYAAVEADIIVNYIPTDQPRDIEDRNFLEQHGVKIKETEFLFPYDMPGREIGRQEYEIPAGAFCLGIVGTRLSAECSREFLRILDTILLNDPDIYVAFIGDVGMSFLQTIQYKSSCAQRYRFLGYQEELMVHLGMLDVFLNPPRMGGGNSGAMAMALGKPVVTLGAGDVAAVAGQEFIAQSLDDYPALVSAYKNDKDFYNAQSERARQKIKEMTTSDEELADIIQQVFDMVE